jgi:hypothetical protein
LLRAVVQIPFDATPRGVRRFHDPRTRSEKLLSLTLPLRHVDSGEEDLRIAVLARDRRARPRDDRARPIRVEERRLVLDSILAGKAAPEVRCLLAHDKDVPELPAANLVAGPAGETTERLVEADDRTVRIEHAKQRRRAVDDRGDEVPLTLELLDAPLELALEPLVLDRQCERPSRRSLGRTSATCHVRIVASAGTGRYRPAPLFGGSGLWGSPGRGPPML